MVHIAWTRKQLDLYAFYQTSDLAGGFRKAAHLQRFHAMLSEEVMPLMERLTGFRLTSVSASCSMYTAGDHLLVHDDRLTDRRIAYVFYVSPWSGAQEWTARMGGALELFAGNADVAPVYPVVRRLPPRNNQLVFFRVGQRSFHQVGEVTSLEYPRLTINGWFHGPPDAKQTEPPTSTPEVSVDDAVSCGPSAQHVDLGARIRASYLRAATKRSIQAAIEELSETSLERFFAPDFYAAVRAELLSGCAANWTIAGPANRRNYERLQVERLPEKSAVRDLVGVLQSAAFFRLLFEYTELDLAGPKAARPSCTVEVRRIGCESYSMLDDASAHAADTLDAIVYFNVGAEEEGGSSNVGVLSYLNPEEEEEEAIEENDSDSDDSDDAQPAAKSGHASGAVLLQVLPKDNTLNLVYRCQGTAKFLHYVSKRHLAAGQHVYMVVASYSE